MCMDHYDLRQTLYLMSEYLLKSDLMNALMHLKCLLLHKISICVCLLVDSCRIVMRYTKTISHGRVKLFQGRCDSRLSVGHKEVPNGAIASICQLCFYC